MGAMWPVTEIELRDVLELERGWKLARAWDHLEHPDYQGIVRLESNRAGEVTDVYVDFEGATQTFKVCDIKPHYYARESDAPGLLADWVEAVAGNTADY